MPGLDPRLISVGLEVNGGIKTYNQELTITAKGTRYGNGIFNEGEITISNLDKATQDYILTVTSPYSLNRTPKVVTLSAGRVSYGLSRIYTGMVFTSNPSQPPDIAVTLRCLENGFNSGNMISRNQGQTPLSTIAMQVAKDNGLTLIFEATDKDVKNYSFTGPASGQVDELGKAGLVDCYVDNGRLIVKNQNVALRGPVRTISSATGMVGIPELTEFGIKVKFFLDNVTAVGNAIRVVSEIYPAANGTYIIYNLSFDIASRDTPFYYIAEGRRMI